MLYLNYNIYIYIFKSIFSCLKNNKMILSRCKVCSLLETLFENVN